MKSSTGTLGDGLDVKAEGGYVVAPPSVHISGRRYEWDVPLDEAELAPAPGWLAKKANTKASEPPDEGKIPHGQQHNALVRLAGSMRRQGANAKEIDAALQQMNRERLEKPGDPAEMTRIAESMMQYRPVDREVWAASQTGRLPGDDPGRTGKRLFTVVTLDAGKARSVQYAMPNRFLVGYLNAVVGRGGSGKGTLASYLIAGWTRGTIPGAYFENPVDVLLVGDEDDFDEMWTPRIGTVGGDLSRVHGLDYTSGTPLNFERDIGELEAHVREHNAKVLYADQILDHIADTRNTHTQADVRHALSPLRGLARRLRITVIYSQHPNKRDRGDLRDLSGGSGQLTDLPRAGTLIGYHPDDPDLRVAAVGKLNVGAIPPPLVFNIEPAAFTNPVTGEVIGTNKVGRIEEDPSLTFESVSLGPVKPPSGPSKHELALAILTELGDDGQWHSRKEAAQTCAREDAGGRVFERAFEALEKETRREGRETHWRLR